MSNETISIEIPAPPPKGATDLEYSQWFQKAKNYLHALYDDQQQEPRELVRFFQSHCPWESEVRLYAEDNLGHLYFYTGSDSCTAYSPTLGWQDDCTGERIGDELHQRLKIRSDGKGGWVAESWTHTSKSHCVDDIYPCDRNGNPLEDKPPHLDNGRLEYDMTKPPVEGWGREGDYWLAPIEWMHRPTILINNGNQVKAVNGYIYRGGYRCVGFLRMDELVADKLVRREGDAGVGSLEHCMCSCPCLLNWQATHAVMKKEGE